MQPEKVIRIGDRLVGKNQPALIIAEAGVNHNGDIALARELVLAAAKAGADIVKFQTWCTEKLITPEAPLADYQARNLGQTKTQFEMLKELELGWEALKELAGLGRKNGILVLSTPDEEDSADALDRLGLCAFKIGSAEVTNISFLQHIAAKGKPLILSTGMSDLAEVDSAVKAIEQTGNKELILLHCVSNYPCLPVECNLRAMETLAQAFGYPVGFSDHSLGTAIPIAAVACGACVIEKHLTLSKGMAGPDHAASLDPAEFSAMVQGIRDCEAAFGSGRKQPVASELAHRPLMRKRWVATRSLVPGTRLERADLALRRSSPEGLDPNQLPLLLGREVGQPIAAWEILTLDKLR